jgi:methyl-accepting chemotaxis protein
MKKHFGILDGGFSLKKKLITCFVLLAAVPLILTTLVTSYLSHTALVNSIYQDNQQTANFLAREMDDSLGSTIQLLKDLAETADIQSMDTARQLALIKKVTGNSDVIKTLIINDPKGAHTVRNQGKLASNGDREYFKQLVGGAEYAFSDIQVGNSSGAAALVIAVPIRDAQKNFKGALLGVIDLGKLSQHIAATKVGQSGYAYLVDRQGKIITHPDQKMMQEMADFSQFAPVQGAIAGKNGIAQYSDQEGEKLAGYSGVSLSGWGVVVQQPLSEAMTKVNQINTTGIIFTLIAILCAITVGIFVAGVITKPIRELVGVANKLSEGDLTVRIHVTTKDEMGHLAQTFNIMADNLRKLIQGVTDTADQVAASSQELFATANQAEQSINLIAVTMTDFAAGSEKQTVEGEKTLQVVDHLTEVSQQVAEKALSAVNLSVGMAKAAETGGEAANNAVQKINEIKVVTEQTSSVVAALGTKSKQIGKILEVISGIAGQTNLLALNAAIEAARAGEHGRGFAVVAEEVRKLAEQSQTATEQIAQIIGEIQQQTDEAMHAMDSGNIKVNEGVDVVQAAGHELASIMERINTSVSMINDINSASKQQFQEAQQMSRSTSDVAAIAKESSSKAQTTAAATEEVTASMEEISSAAEALAKMAGKLQSMVTQFTV